MHELCTLFLKVSFLGVVVLSLSSTLRSVHGRDVPELEKALADVAISGPDARTATALRQLCQVGEVGPLSTETVRRLLEWSVPITQELDPYLSCVLARALATGGPESDRLLLQDLKSTMDAGRGRLAFLLLTVALAQSPAPDVTDEIARIAVSRDLRPSERALFALALAARGDSSRDWIQEIPWSILHPSGQEEVDEALQYGDFMLALPYVAPNLDKDPRLLGHLWQSARQKGLPMPSLVGLTCYSLVRSPVADVPKADTLRTVVATALEGEVVQQATQHLAIASLGGDRQSHVRSALALVGSGGYTTGDHYMLQIVADTLIAEGFIPDIRDALAHGDSDVRTGAVRLAAMMGPTARDLLPVLRDLQDDPGAPRRLPVALQLVAGLDVVGEWRVPAVGKLNGPP